MLTVVKIAPGDSFPAGFGLFVSLPLYGQRRAFLPDDVRQANARTLEDVTGPAAVFCTVSKTIRMLTEGEQRCDLRR